MSIQNARCAAFLAVLLFLCAACGGGGGSGGGVASPVTPTVFSIVLFAPPFGSKDIPNNFSPTVTFNVAVEASTVNSNTFYVTEQASIVRLPAILEISDNSRKVTFCATPWFDTSTDYVLHVSTGVKSTFGESLATPIELHFRTALWPAPEGVSQAMFTVLDQSTNPMSSRRARHTSTLLPKANVLPTDYVLLTGGYSTASTTTASAELFDVSREVFLPIGPMAIRRANHTATFLNSGIVLIVGGEIRIGEVHSSVEHYFPASGTFAAAPSMAVGRSGHTATLLGDGRVLVTGGKAYDQDGYLAPLATGEVYDPVARTWTAVSNSMSTWRYGHQATLLPCGSVMITGGGFWDEHRTADIYDPVHNVFTPVARQAAASRWKHNSILLPTGRVLLTDGGELEGELFTPSPTADTGTYRTIDSADSLERFAASTFEFRPGEVLILGGFEILGNGDWFLHSTMEIYVENLGATGKYFQVSGFPDSGVYLVDPRVFSAWTRLPKQPTEDLHRFLITGGLGNGEQNLCSALLFDPNAK